MTGRTRSRSRFVTIGLGLLLLVGAVFSAACPARSGEGDEDRPPIIITSGSVIVETNAAWANEGGNRFQQRDDRGRNVRSFEAVAGSCRVAGTKLVVTYGANAITLEIKPASVPGKNEASVAFPADAVVDSGVRGRLTVTTTDPLVSIANESGTSCAAATRNTIRQVH